MKNRKREKESIVIEEEEKPKLEPKQERKPESRTKPKTKLSRPRENVRTFVILFPKTFRLISLDFLLGLFSKYASFSKFHISLIDFLANCQLMDGTITQR